MEIIIVLAILGVGLWWYFIRDPKKSEIAEPYKVETPPSTTYEVPEPAATTPISLVVEAPAVAPVKAPTKPKAAAKTPAKPKAAAKTPAKTPAKKAPAKTAKPKVTVAK
jgi:hypothetical protein